MELNEEDDMNVSNEPEDLEGISAIDESIATVNASLDNIFDESFCSFASLQCTSTPNKQKGKKGRRNTNRDKNGNVFKEPAAPPNYVGRCNVCGRGLKTVSGLKNHELAHKWKDAAKRKPSAELISTHCMQAADSIVEEMEKSPAGGKWGEEFNKLLSGVISQKASEEWCDLKKTFCDLIVQGITGQESLSCGVTMPSAYRQHMQVAVNSAFSSQDIRDDIIEKLMRVKICVLEVAWSFSLEFTRKLADVALTFVYRSMSGMDSQPLNERRKRSTDDFGSLFSQQVIHNIAGACMRSHLRHAHQYPQNLRLQRVKDCILTRFATVGGPSVAQPGNVNYWTSLLSRKSYMFVNDSAFPFLLEIAKLLLRMEKPDGSIDHDVILENVSLSPHILSIWDNIVGTSLNEDESFSFMVKVVRSLTNTYGRGILLRRMNSMKGKRNKATLAVSHRTRLL